MFTAAAAPPPARPPASPSTSSRGPSVRRPAVLAIAALALTSVPVPTAHRPSTAAAQALDPLTCAIEGVSSAVDATEVPVGGYVRLKLTWRWSCHNGSLPRDVLVIVDPTTAFAGDDDAELRAANVRASLAGFADQLGWVGGGRFGTISAACPPVTLSPMAGGQAAHAAWRNALAALPSAPARDLDGAYALGAAAIAGLAPAEGLGQPVVLVVDAGGAPCPTAPPPDPGVPFVCPLAAAGGPLVVVLRLPSANIQPDRCHAPGWYFRSSSSLATDVPAILDNVLARLLRAARPPASTRTDLPLDGDRWSVVAAEPPTDPSFPGVVWERRLHGPFSGEETASLTVRAKDGAAPGWHPLTRADGGGIRAVLTAPDGREMAHALSNPPVCVFRPRHQREDCGTPPTPAPTAPAVPSATAVAAPTFSSTLSPTAVPSSTAIALPTVLSTAVSPAATTTPTTTPGRRLWFPWLFDAGPRASP